MTPKSSLSQIILASTSRARREMLAAAGVAFTVEAADVDEPAIRKTLLAAKSAATPPQIADALARAKAEDVSRGTRARSSSAATRCWRWGRSS